MNKFSTLLAITLLLSASPYANADDDNRSEKNERAEHGEMKEHQKSIIGDDVLVAKPAVAATTDSVSAFKAGTTLENLQAAFNGESNAAAKYAAYAVRADEEGYGAVASLFRATSRAEQIHAENHADVIRSKGATPTTDVKPVDVKTTAENLKAAVEGESFERDVMYPAYMEAARRESDRNALRTFNYAQIAESHHATFYTEAGERLVQYKDSKSVAWYVCPTCGETIPASSFTTLTKCPVCFTRTSTFETIQ